MKSVLILFAFGSMTSLLVTASYMCICNRDTLVNQQVFDLVHSPIGYLYPNDCAPFLNNSRTDHGWLSIQFQGERGYIEKQESAVLDECTGPFPTEDEESTEIPMTYTMFVSSSYKPPPPTPVPSHNTTLSPALLGNVNLCPPYVIQGANSNGYLLTQHHHACYEVCQDKVSWNHADMLCKERGGHLVTIHNDKENNYLNQVLQQAYNHRVWIGLHDKINEEHFEWTTGEKVTYTHWRQHHRKSANHTHEDCVLMFQNGVWDDVQCGGKHVMEETINTHAYVCEYKTHGSGSSIVG